MRNRELSIITTLAWRNVWKNKRRTILTFLTILVGCTMIILMHAFDKGVRDRLIEDAVAENIGHIQIHEKGFWENRIIENAIKDDPSLYAKLKGIGEIKSFARRIHAGGLLSFGNVTTGAVIQGIEPEKEAEITTIKSRIVKGGYLERGDTSSILVGETLAKNLGADIGDKIAMISQGFDGSIAAEYLYIKGIIKSQNPEYDKSLVLMPFREARETFAMDDYISAVVIRLKRTDQSEEMRERLETLIGSNDIEVMAWDGLMPELRQFVSMRSSSRYIFDAILFLVVAFGVLNTIQMSVFERIREFGVMLAIGTTPSQVRWMVLAESFIISLIGVVLGDIAGALVSWYFNVNPLNYSAYAKEMSVWGVNSTVFPADMTLANGIITASVILALAMLFSLMPALRASKLRPIEAIRQL